MGIGVSADKRTRPQPYKVLTYFGKHPGATQKDLARQLGRDKAQLARLIKGLRDLGLLSGEADKDDRRSTKLWLTPDGETILTELQKQSKLLGDQAVAGLTGSERTHLLALLGRVSVNLECGQGCGGDPQSDQE